MKDLRRLASGRDLLKGFLKNKIKCVTSFYPLMLFYGFFVLKDVTLKRLILSIFNIKFFETVLHMDAFFADTFEISINDSALYCIACTVEQSQNCILSYFSLLFTKRECLCL